MNFASWTFLGLFLPIVVLAFFLIDGPRRATLRQALLIAASLLFYGVSGLHNLGVLLASMAVNFGAGALLAGESARTLGSRRLILWGAVAANLGFLASFKFYALQADTFDGFLSSPAVLIPIGLSFITFHQIGFVVACYRRQVERPDLFTYLFFIAYFPHLVLGPILQYQPIRDQLKSGALARHSLENLAVGLAIVIFGLAKKVLIADQLGQPVDLLYSQAARGSDLNAMDAWYAAIGFQLQIFFDFSAYADIAIGLSRIFGVNLPINFDRPLFATDRFDLWRRWHITFVVFMRNHVFLPLVRHAKLPPMAALAVTGLLSGLWHGLGLTFVLWGLVQTVLLLGAHWRRQRRRRNLAPPGRAWLVWAIATTFLTTCLVGILFRSPNWQASVEIYGSLLPIEGGGAALSLAFLKTSDLAYLALAAAAGWIWPDTARFFARYWTALDPRPGARHDPALAHSGRVRFVLNPAWAIFMAALLLLVMVRLGEADRFVYVQF